MKELSIQTLAGVINARATPAAGAVTGVSTDSRTAKPGDCFFAIRGENFDGHHYLSEALAKGAACAVVGKDYCTSTSLPLLHVNDTVTALGQLAHYFRLQARFQVVAVTGSAGKTTTRRIIHHVLSHQYPTFQSPENFNNKIGLPLTLLAAEAKHHIVVAELASNYPGEIAYLARIAEPDIALVTNAHPAHLAGFGNLQTIIEEKLSITGGLKKNGSLFINGDIDPLLKACAAKNQRFTTFGKSPNCNIRARSVTLTGASGTFTIENTQIHLPLPGPGNVENSLAAWAVCREFGITLTDFADALHSLAPVPMRAELIEAGSLTILNDCYNANPVSMKNALDMLSALACDNHRRTVFICGDMAELGPQARSLHAQLGRQIAQANVHLLLAVGCYATTTAQAARTAAKYDLPAKCFPDISTACKHLQSFIKNYDIILVKGSRSAALESAVEKLRQLAGRRNRTRDPK